MSHVAYSQGHRKGHDRRAIVIDINTLLGPNVDLRLHEVFEKKDSLRFLEVPADVSAFAPFVDEAVPALLQSMPHDSLRAGALEAA